MEKGQRPWCGNLRVTLSWAKRRLTGIRHSDVLCPGGRGTERGSYYIMKSERRLLGERGGGGGKVRGVIIGVNRESKGQCSTRGSAIRREQRKNTNV